MTTDTPLPDIPPTVQDRYAMTPLERVNSFFRPAARLLEELAIAEELDEGTQNIDRVAIALAAAYADGAREGHSHGYANGYVAGKGGPQ